MAEKGSRIVTGVSGRADSVCLLHVLALLSDRYEWKLAAVHVNHLIREEAGEDAAMWKNAAGSWALPLSHGNRCGTGSAAEEAFCGGGGGRQGALPRFAEAAEDFGADRIAVAHNRNDRAETLLFHIFPRCTGLDGVASIRPVRIIYPVLFCAWAEMRSKAGFWKKDKLVYR